MNSTIEALLYNETEATKRIKIATTAMLCDRDAGQNRQRMVTTVARIMQEHPDVELVLFGEMILGWYLPGEPAGYPRLIGEAIPGPTSQVLALLAQQHGIYICYGISELAGDTLHNTQVLLNPKGEIQAVHRKRNLKSGEAAAGYLPGTTIVTTTDIKGIRTGIVVCSDTASLKTMWTLMRGRYELILHSLADDDSDDFVTKFQGRLYDAWFVTANRFGVEGEHHWPGLITVTDPLGKTRSAQQGGEQFMVYELAIADSGSWLKRVVRRIWVTAPLLAHVLRNWKQAKSYL